MYKELINKIANFNKRLTRISPFGLYEGEAEIVGERLAEELNKI